jgi:hypothetical protein
MYAVLDTAPSLVTEAAYGLARDQSNNGFPKSPRSALGATLPLTDQRVKPAFPEIISSSLIYRFLPLLQRRYTGRVLSSA